MQKSIKGILFLCAFLVSGFLFAQDDDPLGSETVVIVKPYTPSLGDAFKIRADPPSADSLDFTKKEVEYHINSVPVASTFEPAKGRAANLDRPDRQDVYNSYATLGFGSYTSALAEFYTNFEISRTDNFGIFLEHNSSQGGIEDIRVDDEFYNTDFSLNYASRNNKRTWKAEAGVRHELINWYGIPIEWQESFSEEQVEAFDGQQNYLDLYANASVSLEDSFFRGADFEFSRFGDSYDSQEIHAVLKPTLEFEIARELITTTIIADYLSGSFGSAPSEDFDYGYANLGFSPSLLVLRDNLTVNLGIAAFYGMNLENSAAGFFLYPKINASYRLVDEYLIAYAGLVGDLEQNTYNEITQENPFVAPMLKIAPTNKQYNGYLGIKGKILSNLSYDFRGSYVSEDNKPLFVTSGIMVTEPYAYQNSFTLFYDDVKTLSMYGELNLDISRDFSLGVNAEYLSYNTDQEAEAWNLPELKASLNMNYEITEAWFAGASVFYRGERKERVLFSEIEPLIDPLSIASEEFHTLDSYIDANLRLGYKFNEQLSAFVRGNNLLGNNYERWLHYPVQRLQVMAGATYKFDF